MQTDKLIENPESLSEKLSNYSSYSSAGEPGIEATKVIAEEPVMDRSSGRSVLPESKQDVHKDVPRIGVLWYVCYTI